MQSRGPTKVINDKGRWKERERVCQETVLLAQLDDDDDDNDIGF